MNITVMFRALLAELYDEMVHLDERIKTLENKSEKHCTQNEEGLPRRIGYCQRLLSIPSVGLLSTTAVVAAIGDIRVFKNGRELAA